MISIFIYINLLIFQYISYKLVLWQNHINNHDNVINGTSGPQTDRSQEKCWLEYIVGLAQKTNQPSDQAHSRGQRSKPCSRLQTMCVFIFECHTPASLTKMILSWVLLPLRPFRPCHTMGSPSEVIKRCKREVKAAWRARGWTQRGAVMLTWW